MAGSVLIFFIATAAGVLGLNLVGMFASVISVGAILGILFPLYFRRNRLRKALREQKIAVERKSFLEEKLVLQLKDSN